MLLATEHIGSYFIEIFRRNEIDKKGRFDVHGTMRAPIESNLALLQYFYVCFMIGFIV